MPTSKVLKWVLTIAIVVVLNLFFNYAIHLFYAAPQWEKYCPIKQVNIEPQTKEQCLAEGGAWTDQGGMMIYPREPSPVEVGAPRRTSYCDVHFTCNQRFNDYQSVYRRDVFLILIGAGLVSLLIGLLAGLTPPVSLGLSLGGLLSFIIGSIRYWSEMQDYLRVILLGLVLGALIWLGIKKFRE